MDREREREKGREGKSERNGKKETERVEFKFEKERRE
jgi:hypothetical protein